MRLYMLLSPNTLRKYQDAELTLQHLPMTVIHGDQYLIWCCCVFVCVYQEASSDSRSIPLCNIGLNLKVRGNGTLAAPRNKQAVNKQ